MSKVIPFLWFNDNAEQAAEFYLSLFPDARKINSLAPGGKVLTIAIELAGQQMTFLNGGPQFKLTEAFSFSVMCDSQEEIDSYWSALTADGGSEIQCGWLKDKFGLCWQIVPRDIASLLSHPNAMQAMMSMKKFDIAALKAAAAS